MPGRTFLDSLLTPASGSVYREWSTVIVCRLSKQSKKQKLIILQKKKKNNFKTVSGIKTAFYYIMLQQQYFGTTLGSPYIFVIHYSLFFRLWRKLFWRVLQKHRKEQAVEKKKKVLGEPHMKSIDIISFLKNIIFTSTFFYSLS